MFTTAIRGVAALAVLCAAFASAARAQAAMTPDSLNALLADASRTAQQIHTLDVKVLDASTRGKALAEEFARHNAEPCTYPQGQPELCANYDRERLDLTSRVAALQKEWSGYDNERKPLRAHFAALMTRLRDASYPGAMASWKAAMVACANTNGVNEAAACLKTAAARHR